MHFVFTAVGRLAFNGCTAMLCSNWTRSGPGSNSCGNTAAIKELRSAATGVRKKCRLTFTYIKVYFKKNPQKRDFENVLCFYTLLLVFVCSFSFVLKIARGVRLGGSVS